MLDKSYVWIKICKLKFWLNLNLQTKFIIVFHILLSQNFIFKHVFFKATKYDLKHILKIIPLKIQAYPK